jgi:hypothetical protein
MKEMKLKRILIITLCALLISTIPIGLWMIQRLSVLSVYAQQFQIEENGTGIKIVSYGPIEESRLIFDIFQYFTAENLQWTGSLPSGGPPQQQQGPPATIELEISSVTAEQISEDDYHVDAEGLNLYLEIIETVIASIGAEMATVDIEYWNTDEDLPALNATILLEDEVNVVLEINVLPLPGLAYVMYEFQGDQYIIELTILTPLQVEITEPGVEETVGGNVHIASLAKTAQGIEIRGIGWGADGEGRNYGGEMEDPEEDGTWDSTQDWETWHGPDGWYEINVQSEAVQTTNPEGMRYYDSDRISVFVDNGIIPVSSWYWDGQDYAYFEGLEIQWWHYDQSWDQEGNEPFWTYVEIERWSGFDIEVPGGWHLEGIGDIGFERWVVDDDSDPTNGWIEHLGEGNTHVTIDDNWLLETIYESGGHLICLYQLQS